MFGYTDDISNYLAAVNCDYGPNTYINVIFSFFDVMSPICHMSAAHFRILVPFQNVRTVQSIAGVSAGAGTGQRGCFLLSVCMYHRRSNDKVA